MIGLFASYYDLLVAISYLKYQEGIAVEVQFTGCDGEASVRNILKLRGTGEKGDR